MFQVGAFGAVQVGGGAAGRKWLDSGDTPKVERAVFPAGLDTEGVRKEIR